MADAPDSVGAATWVWVDHVDSSMRKYVEYGLEVRTRVGQNDYDFGKWSGDMTHFAASLFTDITRSIGLLTDVAKAMAAERTDQREAP